MAAWQGQPEIAAQLLAAGARTNTKTLDGWNSPAGYTPLHIAAVRGRWAIVMLLVAAGARAGTTNDDGQTALDLAVEEGHASIVRFLKRAMKSSNTGRRTFLYPAPSLIGRMSR